MKTNETNKSLTWNQDFNLSVFHVDYTGRANFFSYFNLMQEAAIHHAHSNQFGLENMRNQNKIWVVTKFELHLFDQAKWGEDLHVETWSRGLIGLTAHREFSIYKKENSGELKMMGKACSVWVPLDLTTRSIATITSNELAHVSLKDKTHDINPRKVEFSAPEFKFVTERQAMNSDIDLNQHVNNAKYVQWVYDAIPQNELKLLPQAGFAINYISEVNLNDQIKIFRNNYKFAGQKQNGKLAFTAEFF